MTALAPARTLSSSSLSSTTTFNVHAHDTAPKPSTASPLDSMPTSPRAVPTDDDIEAIIQMATSARSTTERTGPPRDTRTQLFVGNLPYRVRWQDLKDLFRKAGTVLRADVSLGPDNRSRGYGTVLLASAEDAGRAIDMYNGYSWQSRILEVRPDRLPPDLEAPVSHLGPAIASSGAPPNASLVAPLAQSGLHPEDLLSRPTSASMSTKTLFVGNLPFHCQWQDLKDLFRQAGTILRADVALGPDGRSRGFGMVSFANDTDAERAVKMFNGYEYNGRTLKVHHDKFAASAMGPGSPLPGGSFLTQQQHPSSFGGPSGHIPISQYAQTNGYSFELLHASGPSSPYSLYPPSLPHTTSFLSQASIMHQSQARPSRHEPLNAESPPSTQRSPASSGSHSQTPPTHHPGPISLPPPPPPGAILLPHSHALSPYGHPLGTPLHSHHLAHLHGHAFMTPHGLPPITPGMPSFTFIPQPSPAVAPRVHVSSGQGVGLGFGAAGPDSARTESRDDGMGGDGSASSITAADQPQQAPPSAGTFGMVQQQQQQQQQQHHQHQHHANPAFGPAGTLSPGIPFSPGVVMTPGAFWGPPGRTVNPYINPAVGAPVHLTPGHPREPPREPARAAEEPGYFPPVDYFSPINSSPYNSGGAAAAASAAVSAGSGSSGQSAGSGLSIASPESSSRTMTDTTVVELSPPSRSAEALVTAGMDGLLERLGKMGIAPHQRKDSRTLSMSTGEGGGGRPRVLAGNIDPPPPLHRGDSDPIQSAPSLLAKTASSSSSSSSPYVHAPDAGAAPQVHPVRHVSADALGGGAGVAVGGTTVRGPPGTLNFASLGFDRRGI